MYYSAVVRHLRLRRRIAHAFASEWRCREELSLACSLLVESARPIMLRVRVEGGLGRARAGSPAPREGPRLDRAALQAVRGRPTPPGSRGWAIGRCPHKGCAPFSSRCRHQFARRRAVVVPVGAWGHDHDLAAPRLSHGCDLGAGLGVGLGVGAWVWVCVGGVVDSPSPLPLHSTIRRWGVGVGAGVGVGGQ